MNNIIKIRKGLDIKLAGKAEKSIIGEINFESVSIRPADFPGLIPKLLKKEEDEVKAGEVVFIDKYRPEIVFTSPVSGKIMSVIRGEKRKILEIIIQKNDLNDFVNFPLLADEKSPEKIKELFVNSGIWPLFKQRPYGIIPDPKDTPRDIFISFFDSAPLAADYEFILKNNIEEINLALSKITKLTNGNVFLCFHNNFVLAKDIIEIDNINKYYFKGPHPSGLSGVHINKIKPINKGEIIWTLKATDLTIIGNFIKTGKYYPERIISFAGSEVKNPGYYKTIAGANLSEIIKENVKSQNARIISGNVLTGTNITERPFLGFFDNLVCAIPEGNKYEFLGWLKPGINKFSASATFLSKLFPKKEYEIDTNLHGGKRAYVVTGQYEKVCPIDIYPQILIKAILAEDIDKMEQLGIYEVIEEDLALCEYVCTSKIEVQSILRKGLDLVRKEFA